MMKEDKLDKRYFNPGRPVLYKGPMVQQVLYYPEEMVKLGKRKAWKARVSFSQYCRDALQARLEAK